MLYGRLLDKNSYRCEPLTDLFYPVVLLQGGQRSGDGFIESLRGYLYRVFNVSDISYRDCARSEDHKQKRNRFAFCSLYNTMSYAREEVRSTRSHLAALENLSRMRQGQVRCHHYQRFEPHEAMPGLPA